MIYLTRNEHKDGDYLGLQLDGTYDDFKGLWEDIYDFYKRLDETVEKEGYSATKTYRLHISHKTISGIITKDH